MLLGTSIKKPRRVIAALLSNNYGGGGSLLDSAPFYAQLTKSLVLQRGTGSPTFTRATTATVENNDGYLVQAISGEARFTGARRVKNRIAPTSQDISNAYYVKNGGSVSGTTLFTEDTSTGSHFLQCGPGGALWGTGVVGSIQAIRVKVTPNGRTRLQLYYTHYSTNTSIVTFDCTGAGSIVTETNATGYITANGDGSYECSMITNAGNSNLAILSFYLVSAGTTISYTGDGTSGMHLTNIQVEDVTAQSTQTAGEYVSVGVLSAPYHGAGVDGVKYFDTDISGTPIAADTLKGYLAEGARTNLAFQSQTFANASWAATGISAISEGTTVAPDGTATADTIAATAGAAAHFVSQGGLGLTLNTTFTGSVYLKAGTYNYWTLGLTTNDAGGWFAATADLSSGTISASGDGATGVLSASSITSVGNGWYRLSITGQSSAGANGYFEVSVASSATPTYGSFGRESWTAAGTETGFVWGAQLEAGGFPTSYIPTTTASVPRSSDYLTYQAASNINTATGTAYIEYTLSTSTTVPVVIFGDSAGASYYAWMSSNKLRAYDGTNSVAETGTAIAANVLAKAASRWGSNLAVSLNGSAVGTATFDGAMNTTAIFVGGQNGASQAWGPVKNVRIWQRALSDSELRSITS